MRHFDTSTLQLLENSTVTTVCVNVRESKAAEFRWFSYRIDLNNNYLHFIGIK